MKRLGTTMGDQNVEMRPLTKGGILEEEPKETAIPLGEATAHRSLSPRSLSPRPEEDFMKTVGKFLMCFIGLQTSYLTWGYMQELIMTTEFNPTELPPMANSHLLHFVFFQTDSWPSLSLLLL